MENKIKKNNQLLIFLFSCNFELYLLNNMLLSCKSLRSLLRNSEIYFFFSNCISLSNNSFTSISFDLM